MESLRELYKIGVGPSSSHTIAPSRALKLFDSYFPETSHYHIELYGSLSLTGKGHFTDRVLMETLSKPVSVEFKLNWDYDFDNGLIIYGYKNETLLEKWVVYSLGGGSIKILGFPTNFQKEVYPFESFDSIKKFCEEENMNLVDFVLKYEPEIMEYAKEIVTVMFDCVEKGLTAQGQLLGPFNMPRIAGDLYEKMKDLNEKVVMAYAYAVMEQNATIQTVVTAPTCGSAGVLAAVLYYAYHHEHYSFEKICEALLVGGVFGNIIKQNSTISGAQGGCQAEVGSACSMAAAAYSYLLSDCIKTIEQAAEMAMEHHLGLTCDPVGGYVIIPCIERNAVASQRAIDCALLAVRLNSIKQNRVSFDQVVNTMNYTGCKLAVELKETSLGGLAIEKILPDC